MLTEPPVSKKKKTMLTEPISIREALVQFYFTIKLIIQQIFRTAPEV
jgi:hypothetical protein